MGAPADSKKPPGKRSSAGRGDNCVKIKEEMKGRRLESRCGNRKKSLETNLQNASVKEKKEVQSNSSISSSKNSTRRNKGSAGELSKSVDGQEKKSNLGSNLQSAVKSTESPSSDTGTKRIKVEKESRGRRKLSTEHSQDESILTSSKESLKLRGGSKRTSKRESVKASEDSECDFSKIESLIFEDHPNKGISRKKQVVPHKEKGKLIEIDAKVKEKESRPKKLLRVEKKSKISKDEGKDQNSIKHKGRKYKNTASREKHSENVSDSDMSDWEEVDNAQEEVNELEALLDDSKNKELSVAKSVKIELDAPDVLWGMKKRRKRKTHDEMIEEYLRKHVNRSIKEVHENMHKAHLLCLFAHGQYVNRALNSDTLLGAALSLITDKKVYPPKRLDMSYLEKFVKWFSRKISLKVQDVEEDYWNIPLESLMIKRFGDSLALSNRELVYMFVIMTRALGMNVRLVISLQPMTWRPSADALIKRMKTEEESLTCSSSKPSCSKAVSVNENESQIKEKNPKAKNSRKMLSSDSSDGVPVKGVKKASSKNSHSEHIPLKTKKKLSESDDSDSDFDPLSVVKRGPKASVVSKKRKSLEGNGDSNKKGRNEGKETKKRKAELFLEWAEIYVEEEEKWMCIDISKTKLHCIAEIEARIPSSSAYITAYNGNLTVKDVTKRYIASWLSNENKLRCCSSWWEKSLRPFRGKRTRLDKEEDHEIDQNLRLQPLPKVIGEYKNHPLYALQRHLLKFEAIYPPDESPVGFIKGEPVYPRSSVYTLCSRDTWFKEAKTVRVDEEPYKIVKARPKWDRNTCQIIKDLPLEVFGEWQVEDYEPPIATDGKVPRNEYGNVDLFKPSMLPKGCVHLPIPGLNRIARKLNIDCAAAMVGFDFHSGWTHPVYEGFVVCEEFQETLIDAWNQDQAEQAKRAEEKRQKRIYDNWKKLIRGMMVKQSIWEKYGSALKPEDEEDEAESKTSNEKDKAEKKNSAKKTKITQEDIDAERPPLITHRVKNLKIDLASNVVDMAKASRKRSMKTSNTVKAKVKKGKRESLQHKPIDKGNLDDSSGESDEEEKKEKIRAILQWGTEAVKSNPNLSDDSDREEGSRSPSCSKSSFSLKYNLPANNISQFLQSKQKKFKPKGNKKGQFENCSETSSSASTHSTTPEPCAEDLQDVGQRRTSRRSAIKKRVVYTESDGDDGGDISLGESDVEDKTFNPLKENKKSSKFGDDDLNLSESDSD